MDDELNERWNRMCAARSHLSIPIQSDFCCDPGGDGGFSWETFGGLSIDKVYEKFLISPEIFQENFMYLFPKAFDYYFPVVDRFLRSVNILDEDLGLEDGCEAWILASAIESQFHWKSGMQPSSFVIEEIKDLSYFVRNNLNNYSVNPIEINKIDIRWSDLENTLASFRFSGT